LGVAQERPSSELDEPLTFGIAELEGMARRPYSSHKRAIDLVVASLLLVLTAPLILIVGLIVMLDVGLPAVFWQQRPGLRGKPFKLYKFRTMRAAHDQDGKRIPDDRRLSFVGSLLRRTRLDELPQIYNILFGEMSFVGPRPLLPIDQPAEFAARLLVRPGLTGWAQVSGGREISPRDKAALDVWYVRNASLWLDIEILARTVPMIVWGERARPDTVRKAWDELARLRVAGQERPEIALQPSTAGGGGGRQHAA
jgi:lipopolysaccharide/colanic/teichoic acid biosynthesis glycosyltransferase